DRNDLAGRTLLAEKLRPAIAVRQTQPAFLRDLVGNRVEQLERRRGSANEDAHQRIAITGAERKSSRFMLGAASGLRLISLAAFSMAMNGSIFALPAACLVIARAEPFSSTLAFSTAQRMTPCPA